MENNNLVTFILGLIICFASVGIGYDIGEMSGTEKNKKYYETLEKTSELQFKQYEMEIRTDSLTIEILKATINVMERRMEVMQRMYERKNR